MFVSIYVHVCVTYIVLLTHLTFLYVIPFQSFLIFLLPILNRIFCKKNEKYPEKTRQNKNKNYV